MIILVCLFVVALILLIVGIYEYNTTLCTGALKFSVFLFIFIAIAAVVLFTNFKPVVIDCEGQIETVGSEGVTVVYPNKNGETTKTQIIVEAPEKYNIGDTVTIRLEQDIWTWILNATMLDDETE